MDADRTGLARQETQILDVSLPKLNVPLNPGKNLTVISEVVAMNHLLRMTGIDSAAAFREVCSPGRQLPPHRGPRTRRRTASRTAR